MWLQSHYFLLPKQHYWESRVREARIQALEKMEMSRMEFCAECGSRLKPVKVNSGKQAMIMMACTKCGQKTRGLEVGNKLKSKFIEHSPKQLVAIIGKEEQELTTLPTIKIECPNCGNNTANVWQVQTRGLDESSTQFLRCLKCGFTHREYT